MTARRDYYEILGVAKDASEKDIKQAYRKVALQNHPDRNPGDAAAEERFKDAAEAYEVLSDPQKRAAFDRYGHEGVRGNVRGFSNFEDIFSSFGSIFEEFFGGRAATGAGGAGRGGPRAGRGDDLRLEVELSFEEAAKGVEKTVEVERLQECSTCRGSGAKPGTRPETCATCRGAGQVARSQGFFTIASACPRCRGEGITIAEHCPDCSGERATPRRSKLTVKIPAGVDSGARLRMAGEGDGGRGGGPAGDLYIFLSVTPHEYFLRDGNDIILEHALSMTEAALGTTVEVPTLEGPTEVKVAAGTQPGDSIRLRGKGFPNLRGFGRGEQVVRFNVKVPTSLSRQQRKLLEEFAKSLGDAD